LPIQKSKAKLCCYRMRNRQPNYVVVDFKLAIKNCIATDSKIRSQTMLLPIQKLTAKNFANVDSKIGSQKLCPCRFKNRQRWWSHFGFTSLFFFGRLHSVLVKFILCVCLNPSSQIYLYPHNLNLFSFSR
jgi:hypothetical protein